MEVNVRKWFRTQPAGVDTTPEAVEAYREGRADERQRMDSAPIGAPAARARRAELEAAYERGRVRGRPRRGASPLLTLVLLLAVVVAGVMIYLAIQNGSFSNGGAVVDQKLDQVAKTVDAPIKNAAITTGSALQDAGQRLK
jgi:flagellin-like protein